MSDYIFVAAPIAAIISLIYAFCLSRKINKFSEGTDVMKKIAASIRQGANAFLKRQYSTVIKIFVVVFIILGILSILRILNPYVPFAFLTGGIWSGLSGFIGMKIATSANSRTAFAAQESLNKGLTVAFSSGAVMGFTVVGLGLFDISFWFCILKFVFCAGMSPESQAQHISSAMLTFGMGASFMALFARVGGGIFTKAADVGADLVGKVEAGIPEDDPRNPAVIADNVGDNVGDVAGMGADLYESYVGSVLATLALGVAAGYGFQGIFVPMLMAALGIICSIIGTFFVRTGENTDQKILLKALRKGTYLAAVLFAVFSFPVVYFVLDCANYPARLGVYAAVLCGLIAGVIIGAITEYFTSDTYKPTQEVAESSATGPATVIISGLALGLGSAAIPVIVISVAVLISFYCCGGAVNFNTGLYGIGIAAVGMLSTLGITLATDAYGPVADNAGGIAEMSHLPHVVRERTDALDSLGNTTAATGKGFAIGSAALTALALIAAYVDQVKVLSGVEIMPVLTDPRVLIGLFIGGMMAFLFSSMTMKSVGRAAQSIVVEVRRQFREISGLMEGTAEPDYAKCVDICTSGALKEMVKPAICAIVAPIITGLILGVHGVIGLLGGVTVTGFLLAIMMANAGGSWDNAKKYIEAGKLGGKGSDSHKAAVVGDTVGDPFKDTSGPSINILIKLISVVSIVFAAVVINYSIFSL